MDKDLKKQPIVVFDFDNTLFDSMQLKFLFGGIAQVNGFSEPEAREFYAAARNEENGIIAITLDRFVDEVRRRCVADGKKFNEQATVAVVAQVKNKGKELLLPGAKELLDFCQWKNFPYHLLSLGVRAWQLEKMRWVELDKIFNDKNTVFTVKESGGKIEALHDLFGLDFNGESTVLFNDRVDESEQLLAEFSSLTVFLRYDERDVRSTGAGLSSLRARFGERVFVAKNLIELLDFFKKYVGE